MAFVPPQPRTPGWSTLEVVEPGYSYLEVAPDQRSLQVGNGQAVDPKHSQLQVAEYENSPQVVGEGVVDKGYMRGNDLEVLPVTHPKSTAPSSLYDDAPPTESAAAVPTGVAAREKRPLMRRRRTWILLCTVVLAILGVVLGVVFGVVLRKQNNDGDSSNSNRGEVAPGNGNGSAEPPPDTSALKAVPKCAESFCPQSLNGLVESYTAVDQSPTIHLLVRDRVADIQYMASAPGGKSFPNKWRSYGNSGFYPDTLASTFLSINGRHSISFFGLVSGSPVASFDHVAYRTIDIANGSASDAIYLGNDGLVARSAPVVCAPPNSDMNGAPPTDMSIFKRGQFSRDKNGDPASIWWRFSHGTPGTFHDKYIHEVADIVPDSMPNVPPGLACRDGPTMRHDVVVYSNATDGFAAYHEWYDFRNFTWSKSHKVGGTFKQGTRPILVEVSKDRFDFFGIGADDAMHHFTFEQQGNPQYSKMESLGGSFASNAAGVAMGAARDRVDVVAIGKGDGRLKRRALVGTRWDAEWVDLGVTASSVPRLMRIADDELIITIVAADKTVWYSEVKIQGDGSWSELKWQAIGGIRVEW
ncbi:hypothetical protein MCOR27_010148 [Pyricularia oryzae]|nr:hypothetical protein MCOR02_000184 [Pyricularia oryzae]KAI6256415.1 hypothetical protein MCOR19_007134 [Pyricularia oryzae]KAI6268472.1 hypothetical protein MCOR27_010148 [Pyricularia oryzae]KAI6269879.1 hypothetical protein MCOR26_008494 [Pyricularia oryzae]KAI6305497.1 hypothetical protein MCOR29_010456 [Pyricularia oryzae]